ncbi:MAG: porin [Burkholderiaceae bacterium]|nr:porin [Burkholderiaceae bacterium]
MKMNTIAAALALTLAGGAWAQSSVVVSGIADAAARSVNNEGSGSIQSLVSGSNSTSRLVFRGTEDLGDGLSAGFWLESGIALDTGSSTGGTQLFDRRSTVSLSTPIAGEARLGRDYVPTYTAWVRHDPFSHVGVAGSNNFAGSGPTGPIRAAFGTNPNTTVRSSNSLQYLLPGGLGGLQGGLMVAAGEGGSAAGGAHKLSGARLGWSSGAYGVVAATSRTTNDITGPSNKFTDTVVGGNAEFGSLKLAAAWRQFKVTTSKQTNTLLSAVYTMGLNEFKASYLIGNLSGQVGKANIDANDATQLGLGYVYHLSKRSALYTTFSRIDNDGQANFVIPGGPTLVAGRKSTGYEAGVRHSF